MSTKDTAHFNVTRGALALYRHMEALGAPQTPLYEAAATGHVRLLNILHPDMPWPADLLAEHRKPTIIVVNDDPGSPKSALGPNGWACAKGIGSWPAAALIHGAMGSPEEYNMAVVNAMLALRVIIVETMPMHALAWNAVVHCSNTLMLLPAPSTSGSGERVLH